MHDIKDAEPVYDPQTYRLIGYILKLAEDAWLPLNLHGENYTGPSYKKDACDIVILHNQDSGQQLDVPLLPR